jgi:hypothetical protein
MCRLFLESRLICQEVRQLLADIRDVWLSWLTLATATATVLWFTAITGVCGVVLTKRWGSINQVIGGVCVPISCGCTHFAGRVLTEGRRLLPKLWTTCYPLRMEVPA